MVDYKAADIVTQLRCDPRHYFHTECLESWIKGGHNQCPYCRAIIPYKLDRKYDIDYQHMIPEEYIDENGNETFTATKAQEILMIGRSS